jgi:predicted XRE-type DNA-binding protein
MKIKSIKVNNRKKCFEIITSDRREFIFPYSKLVLKPQQDNKIADVFVDKEIGLEGFTYVLENGNEDTVHIDDILFYNKNPDYMKEVRLHEMTCEALSLLEEKKVSKNEIARRMDCTKTQLNRLLDPTFYGKSTDQMIKLLNALDCKVEFNYSKAS